MNDTEFQTTVWQHYDRNKRDMPWRGNTEPYWILVSELMLQQTQASRVAPKFEQFIAAFPTIGSLAKASFEQVLQQWSGLGYNRRAKFLWQSAQEIVNIHGGTVPKDLAQLEALPGIGPNTAGAILAYAYNMPVVYIETNIRTVYLHHFFPGQTNVHDKQLMPLIQQTLPNLCHKHTHSNTATTLEREQRPSHVGTFGVLLAEKRKRVV